MRKLILFASSFLLASCAHYTPKPISDPGSAAILQAPVAAVLSQQATEIDRPYLTPVSIDLSAPLNPNQIAIIAVLSNPDLKAMRARAGVSDAQVFAAGLLPDPSFSMGIDEPVSGPPVAANIVSALGFSLNSLRTRSVLREQAKASNQQVRLDLAWAEWQISGNSRLQAVRVLELRKALAIASASEKSSASLLSRYLRASGRGDIPADQVQSARLSSIDAITNKQTTETSLIAAEYELRRLLGLAPDYDLALAPQVLPQRAVDSATLFAFASDNRTDLRALRAGYDAQEAAVHKAVLDQFPIFDLTLNGTRDTGRSTLFGPSVGLTLPLWNRNRGGIAVERATREALRTEYDARLFQTRADIAAAVGGLNIARQQRIAIMGGLPEIEQFALATRRAAERGDLAIATAEAAEQSVRDKHFLLIQIEQAITEQTIALELLVGAPQEAWN